MYSLSLQSVVIHSQNMPEPSQCSLIMRFIFSSCVCTLTSRYWLCLSVRCPLFVFGTCGVQLLASSFVQGSVATILHRITLWTSLPTHTISLWVWCWYACASTLISVFKIRCWLCWFLFGSLCCSYCYLSHSCPDNIIPWSSQLQHFPFGFTCYQPNHLRSLSYTCHHSYATRTFYLFYSCGHLCIVS